MTFSASGGAHLKKGEHSTGSIRGLVRWYRCCTGPGSVKSFPPRKKITADTYRHRGQEGCAQVHREHHYVC